MASSVEHIISYIIYINIIINKTSKNPVPPSFAIYQHQGVPFTRTPRCIDRGSGRDAKGISRNLVWDKFNATWPSLTEQLMHQVASNADPTALGLATYSPQQVQSRQDDLPWYPSDLVHLMKLLSSNFNKPFSMDTHAHGQFSCSQSTFVHLIEFVNLYLHP